MADKLFQLRLAQCFQINDSDPIVARHVRRGNNTFNLYQFGKFLRSAFKGHFGWTQRWLKISDAKHLSRNTKQQVVLPLHVFSCVRQREAKGAHPVNVRIHKERRAPAICLSSSGLRTVRRSKRTRPSSTRATIGTEWRRRRAAISSSLRDCAVTASRNVGKEDVGAEPPPTSDSPEMISVFKCWAAC